MKWFMEEKRWTIVHSTSSGIIHGDIKHKTKVASVKKKNTISFVGFLELLNLPASSEYTKRYHTKMTYYFPRICLFH